jgi:hypothetical protein
MSSPSPVPAPVLEQDKQQPLTNESPTDPIDEWYRQPMEELKVYSRRQKSKIIPHATCQISDHDSCNTISIPD